ncbi:MAG: glycosyltransferase family 2 protein [Actinomycetota bacterium]|nr:glycosyltransferase family 2 protein [Actinomycetota bacterium]
MTRSGAGAGVASRLAAVVVDYDAGDVLGACVRSLRDDGVREIVVVENGDPMNARRALGGLRVPVVVTGRNLGYGAGANRGIASSGGSEHVLVCNPDLQVHPGATERLVAALDAHPDWAIVGPRIVDPDGVEYPSVRRFPSMTDAAGHALLALVKPDNRFSRRYRDVVGQEPRAVDWVSGACFCARRTALEELGGFDEAYFMFAEDIDLCWRAHRAGWGVGVEPRAEVTHVHGVSRRHHPYRMLAAHHRSALRFAARRSQGLERLALPAAAAALGVRLGMALTDEALRRRREAVISRAAGRDGVRA